MNRLNPVVMVCAAVVLGGSAVSLIGSQARGDVGVYAVNDREQSGTAVEMEVLVDAVVADSAAEGAEQTGDDEARSVMADASRGDVRVPEEGGRSASTEAKAPWKSSKVHHEWGLGSIPGASHGYYEYLPPSYDDSTASGGEGSPLLVYLHGIGGNGDGKDRMHKVLRLGPARVIEADLWPKERPFIVLSPQHASGGCWGADEIHDFLDFATRKYNVDPARIYLTGLSCGAIGGWSYLAKHHGERVAAAVLIAGNGRKAWDAAGCRLGEVAIWAFHGDLDKTVPFAGTAEPMAKLDGCPAPPRLETKFTIYEGLAHNDILWEQTYDGSAGYDIYSWMLGIRKGASKHAASDLGAVTPR
ncbi:MAG: hypothetical protein ACPHRO_02185 [Nannocystaceae bacterium]